MKSTQTIQPTIFLIGGSNIFAETAAEVDKKLVEILPTKSLLVLDLSTDDLSQRASVKPILRKYFMSAGLKDLQFFSDIMNSGQSNSELLANQNLYLPGGDTETLLKNLKQHKLVDLILSHNGILAGNSAGAIALCKDAILTPDQDILELQILEGLGKIDFSVDPHYEDSHDIDLIPLSYERKVYGLTEDSAMVLNGAIEFFGQVYEFNNGIKILR